MVVPGHITEKEEVNRAQDREKPGRPRSSGLQESPGSCGKEVLALPFPTLGREALELQSSDPASLPVLVPFLRAR